MMMNDIKKALFFVWGAAYASGIFLLYMFDIEVYGSMIPVLVIVMLSSVGILFLVAYWFICNWSE